MRLRFSPVNVFGCIAIAGVSLGWWKSMREQQAIVARHEQTLKDWIEPLEIHDTTLVHFRRLPRRNVGFDQWRIYLPPGRSYEMCCILANPFAADARSRFMMLESIPIPSGQSLFEVDWRQDLEQKPQISFAALPPRSEKTLRRKVSFPDWFATSFADSRPHQELYLGDTESTTHDATKMVQLAAVTRDFTPNETTTSPTQPTRGGFLVVIRPVDAPTASPATKTTTNATAR
ncbi:MAG: hypothetical protein ACKO38_05530 [Planctomycetota bacterium]